MTLHVQRRTPVSVAISEMKLIYNRPSGQLGGGRIIISLNCTSLQIQWSSLKVITLVLDKTENVKTKIFKYMYIVATR